MRRNKQALGSHRQQSPSFPPHQPAALLPFQEMVRKLYLETPYKHDFDFSLDFFLWGGHPEHSIEGSWGKLGIGALVRSIPMTQW